MGLNDIFWGKKSRENYKTKKKIVFCIDLNISSGKNLNFKNIECLWCN